MDLGQPLFAPRHSTPLLSYLPKNTRDSNCQDRYDQEVGNSRLLLITPQVRSRESYLLQLLSELVPVSVMSLRPAHRPVEIPGLFPAKQEQVRSWPWLWPVEQWIGDWTSAVPGSCSWNLIKTLRTLQSRDSPPRWIWFSGASMAGVVSEARRLGYRVIVDHDRMPSAQVLRDASTHWSHWVRLPEAWRDLYYERRRCERAHAVVTSSPLYAARARKLAPETPVYVIGPSVQWQQFQDDREPCGSSLSFCGDLEDPAQVQGVRWFAEEVLPRLRAALKEKAPPVLVAGPEASPVLLDFLKHHAISALTWKKHDALAARENTLKCLKQSMIAFIPLQQKTSGAQFLLNAMAMRRPVVTTSKGAEGLQLNPGREIWLGDQPDTFTSALIRLIREPELRAETSRHAHLRLTEDFDLEKTRRTLQGLLHQL